MSKQFRRFLAHNAMDYYTMECMLRGDYVSISDKVAAKARSRSDIALDSNRTYDTHTSMAYTNHLIGQHKTSLGIVRKV